MIEAVFSDQWLLLLVLVVVLFGIAQIGFAIGLRLHKKNDEARRSQIGGIQGAVLGLLGLLLGFTFAMAVDLYKTRRDLVVQEANAVGTTWLRGGLLPEPHQEPVRDLLRRYVDVRLKYVALTGDPVKLAEGLQLGAELQKELWHHAELAATEAPNAMTATFITSLNEVIDTDAQRVAAGRNRIPSSVWVLLLMVAAFGCFAASYGTGARGSRWFLTNLLLPTLISLVIFLIFDLTHSKQGFIGISQQPLIDLQRSIQPAGEVETQ